MPPERGSIKHVRITARLIPATFGTCLVNIAHGEPHASIGLNRASIRFPEPFDQHGLTDACRAFIAEAVKHAVENDGHLRSITWSDAPSNHHGGQHD